MDFFNLLFIKWVFFPHFLGARPLWINGSVCKRHSNVQVSRMLKITIDVVKNKCVLFTSIDILFID